MECDKEFIQCLLFVSKNPASKDFGKVQSSVNEECTTKGFVILPSSVTASDSEINKLFSRNNVKILDSQPSPLLQTAVKHKHTEVLELIVTESTKKDVFISKTTPFFPVSVQDGNEDKVRQIFGNDVVIYKRSYESSEICKAIDENNSEIMKRLLTVTADISHRNPFGGTLLHFTVFREDEILVKLLVKHGANLNPKRPKDWSTPLHIAVEVGSLDMVSLLLQQGAGVNARRKDGSTSLFLALELFHPEIVQLLLRNGADINIGKCSGLTPLHLAANNNMPEIVDDLLRMGANVNASATYCYAEGVTPLCLAVEWKFFEIVERLLESGADVNIPCYDDQTVLKLAVERECVSMVEIILKYHPDLTNKINQKALSESVAKGGRSFDQIAQMLLQYGFTVDAESENTSELLHNAICKNYISVVERLLDSGVSVNRVYHYYDGNLEYVKKTTPLLTAIEYERNDIVKLLIDRGADISVNLDLDSGTTPVRMASHNFELVKILLSCIVDHFQREYVIDHDAEEIIHSAIGHNSPEIVEKLLEESTTVGDRSCLPKVPLNFAVKNSCLKVLKILIKFGVSVDSRDEDGLTFLHCVTDRDCGEKVKLLVKNNADLEARCLIGQTPIFKAVKKGYLGVVNELLKYGAKVDKVDTFNRSPFHYAVAEGHFKVLKVLSEYSFTCDKFAQKANILQLFRLPFLSSFRNMGNDSYLYDQYKRYRNRFKGSLKTLLRYLLVMEVAFSKDESVMLLFNQHLRFLAEGVLKTFYDKLLSCDQTIHRREVVRMKSQNVGTTSISYYDILTKDEQHLARYLRNRNVVETLNSINYKNRFLEYSCILSCQIQKGTFRRKLLDQSVKDCHLLVSELELLPLDLKEEVLSYLSNTELEVTVHACRCISQT